MKKRIKAAKHEATVVQPPVAASIRQAVMVVIGGTKEKPVTTDAALVAPVVANEIAQYGNDRKRVIVGLSMNLLSGIGLSREVLNKDNACWSARHLRTDKLAFFKILESGLTQAQLQDAWAQTLADRKRYDEPTLQALSKAARAYKILSGTLEAKVSPMEKFARDCLDVMNNRTLDTTEILRVIREKLTEKANYTASVATTLRAAA